VAAQEAVFVLAERLRHRGALLDGADMGSGWIGMPMKRKRMRMAMTG
jgi:hypothetical protein